MGLVKVLFAMMLWTSILSAKAQAREIVIDISRSAAQSLSSRDFPEHGAATHFFHSPEVITDARVWDYYSDLNMPIVRFPGGLANWYDWETGRIETKGKAIYRFMEGERFADVSLDDVAHIAKKYNLSLIYSLNLNDPPERISELANEWRRLSIPVRAVEMGNELYTKKFSDELGGIKIYLDKAKKALFALRKGGFRGQVGVEVAPEWTPGEERHVHQHHWKKWNQAMALDGLVDFDAVIMHYYPTSTTGNFNDAVSPGIEGLTRSMKWLKGHFPGKRIWITEWNIGLPKHNGFNTLQHALFVMDMIQAMMEARVEIACYHVLTGFGFELMGPDRLVRAGASKNDTTTLLKRMPYFAFLLYKKAAAGNLLMSGRDEDFHFMLFKKGEEFNALLWSDKSLSANVSIRDGRTRYQYHDGYGINGPLKANNGSTLNFIEEKPRVVESPEPVHLRRVDNPNAIMPGIWLYRYKRVSE